MLRLSVCIDTMFVDREFPARIDAVAEAGITGFEFWQWSGKDLEAIVERQRRHGLAVTNLCLDPLVCLLNSDSIPAFVEAVRSSCRVAQRLGCERITAHVDKVPFGPGSHWYSVLGNEREIRLRHEQRSNIIAAFKAAAPIAEDEGITLLLEPLNTLVDHNGYFLASSEEGFSIIQEVGSRALRLLFDIYHQQITEGNLIGNIVDHVDLIGYLHVADVPGRHEPGTGEINFLNVLAAAKRAGFNGYVGLEYMPTGDPEESMRVVSQIIDQINRE